MQLGAPDPRPRPSLRAEGVRWDLGELAADPAAVRRAMAAYVDAARAFEQRHRGRIASMSPAELAGMLREYAAMERDAGRAALYAHLRESVEGDDPAVGALSIAVSAAAREAADHLRFVGLEWQALPPARAAALAADPALAPYRIHLDDLTEDAPHTLSEAAEHMLDVRADSARTLWQRLFARMMSRISVTFDAGAGPRPHTFDELLSYLHAGDRDLRRRALEAAYAELAREPLPIVQAQCYDAIVRDRLAVDRERGYVDPMRPANRANHLSDTVVENLLVAVEQRFPVAQRWFRSKAAAMGLPVLQLHDQYAPAAPDPATYDLDTARRTFMAAMRRFSPRAASLLGEVFERRHVDAEPRPGKRGGAFCAGAGAGRVLPYVLLNFTGRLRDVFVMAHELGHALQDVLAGRSRNELTWHPGLAVAEIASTFNEMVLLEHLMATERDPVARRALAATAVEDAFATIFRQAVMARYEQAAYRAVRDDGATLDPALLSRLWLEQNRAYYGDSVELPGYYALGWAYVPHFINSRFYTYSYTFAKLASLTLYARYRQEGAAFVPKYLRMLSLGGSRPTAELLAEVGIDITDPHWVDAGFAELERLIALAEGGPAAAAA